MKILPFKRRFQLGNEMMERNQRGMSLLIAFFVMAIILSMVLALTSLLLNQMKTMRDAGSSMAAFYAAESGLEKTLYFNRKMVPLNARIGLCGICRECPLTDTTDPFGDPIAHCNNCQNISLSADLGGCDSRSCSECLVTYETNFNGRRYVVSATVRSDVHNPSRRHLTIESKGFYRNVSRSSSYFEDF